MWTSNPAKPKHKVEQKGEHHQLQVWKFWGHVKKERKITFPPLLFLPVLLQFYLVQSVFLKQWRLLFTISSLIRTSAILRLAEDFLIFQHILMISLILSDNINLGNFETTYQMYLFFIFIDLSILQSIHCTTSTSKEATFKENCF